MKFSQAYGSKDMERLISEWYPRLVGYASAMLDYEHAKDVAQEVFLYIWNHRSRIEVPDNEPREHAIVKYMFSICRSRMIDMVRSSGRMALRSPEQMLRMEEDLNWVERRGEEILKSLGEKELLNSVMEEVRKMPANRQKVFKLSVLHGYRNLEISEILGIPLRTVEGHLYLSLKMLREKFNLITT